MSKRIPTIQIKNAHKVIKQLESINQAAEKTIDMTVKDFKRRAPAWVSKATRTEYGISASDINPSKGKDNVKQAGNVSVRGETVSAAQIVYSGRVLTPTHFGMTPKVPNKGSTTIKAKIKQQGGKKTMGVAKRLTKKQRKELGKNFRRQGRQRSRKSPVMLIRTGKKKEEKGVSHIPMQRVTRDRRKLHAIKTVSLPQMIDNRAVRRTIEAEVQEKLSKRIDHYVDRYMGK